LSEVSVLIFAGALGFTWLGTVPLTSGVIAVLFGPAYMSMLYGVAFFSHQIGGFLGAWMAGAIFDAVGSYDAVWWLSVVLGLASALLHWPIVERPVSRLATGAPAPA
jgi:predicted MFS family arabinose efflux permease